MTKVLVTGATGFLGHQLVPSLATEYEVRALALPSEDAGWLERSGVTVYRGDVRDAGTLTEPMKGVDVVYHLAGAHGLWRSVADYRQVNVTGTANVCRTAMSLGVRRLIHISSWTVYGMGYPHPVREDHQLRPIPDPYTTTKAEADAMVQHLISEGLPAVIIRPGTMFGPGDRVNFGRMVERLKSGRAIIIGSGRNAVPFVHVADVVRGLLLAGTATTAVGHSYNLSHDAPLTQSELWGAVAREFGIEPPRLRLPYRALLMLAFVSEKAVTIAHSARQPLLTRLGVKMFGSNNRHSIDRARADLGYSPKVDLAEGVRLTAEWYQEEQARRAAGLKAISRVGSSEPQAGAA